MTSPLRPVDSAPDNPSDLVEFIRPLPHSIEAEQHVLGAVMLSPFVLAEVRTLLDGSEFYRPAHQIIWDAITTLADQGAPFEPVAVASAIDPRDLAKIGGAPYLHTLISQVPVTANATYYAQLVRNLAYARRVIETGTRLMQLGYGTNGDTESDLRGAVAAEVAALTEADARGWPNPAPLSATPDLPTFPVWAFPDWLAEYTARLAEATQTPPDLAGSLALAVLAVAAGGKVWVQGRPGWTEPTNLFTLVVLPPGNRKSEVYKHMTAPIRAAEAILVEQAKPVIAEAVIARRVAEAHAEKTEKAAAAASDPDDQAAALDEAATARLALGETTIPAEPCLFSDDATMERLTTHLFEQGGRFAILSPEGEIFSIAAGRYSGAPGFAVLKAGHAGEEMRIDRVGRPPERIPAATITLGICTQPGVLARLGETPQFLEQGLLGRLLYSLPKSLLGYRDPNPEPIPPSFTDTYRTNVTSLILSLHALSEPATLRCAPDTEAAITALLAETEPRFRPGGDLAHMTDWGGKYVGAVVRIAALLHLAEHFRNGWDRPISLATFQAARQIGEYYTVHAQAAYDAIGADPAVADARALLEWIKRTGTTQFSPRDVLSSLRRFKKVADLEPGLRVLESHGWIRRIPTAPKTGRGRKPGPVYETHPDATGTAL